MIINLLFLMAGSFLPNMHDWIVNTFALHTIQSPDFKLWQIITHMFMHGDMRLDNASLWHLFSNMFTLWVFGSYLEYAWGSKRFLNFYLICGVGAALLHLLVLNYEYTAFVKNAADFLQYQDWAYFNKFAQKNYGMGMHDISELKNIIVNWGDDPTSKYYLTEANKFIINEKSAMLSSVTVGASGAVFGILFAFAYLFPNTLLYFNILIPIKAKYLATFWGLNELIQGVNHTAGDNVAHFAHLGGMLVAFIILKFFYQKDRTRFY